MSEYVKSAVITGASGGIGGACARLFAESGWNVLIGYRENEEKARELSYELKSFGIKAPVFGADVSDPADAGRLMSKAIYEFGGIDALVNNAGISCDRLFFDTDEEDFERVFGVNVKSTFFCTKSAGEYMKQRGSGSVVNIASVWGQTGAAGEALYSSSKAAVIGLTKALAKELSAYGVRVNCVCPGVIDTAMNSCYGEDAMRSLASRTPLGRIGTPREVAEAVMFLADEKSGFITGQILGVNGGFYI